MRRLLLIGIGAGDPALVTQEAIAALGQVDVFIVNDKGPGAADLLALRTEILERFVPDGDYRLVQLADPVRDPTLPYAEAVRRWHDERATGLERTLIEEVPDGGCAGILVWGDPALYDSTIRLVERIMARAGVELDWAVVPGISSVALLAARHRITLNRVGGSVLITTGRAVGQGEADTAADIVVMLDADHAFRRFVGQPCDIYWGAYLGTPHELLVAGPLAEVAEQIVTVRTEARARHGWMFDVYLLRRLGSG